MILWGFIAATLRFLPYIGPWVGALFPITMTLATSDGWWQPLIVFVFIMVVELIVNNVFEPLLFGHMTGVSPTALLVSAAFWLYLWGPVGLVLSAPFAVCLVVLGKNVKELGFLYLLMGNKPALELTYSFYQRALLGDYPEAIALALNYPNTASPETIFDELLVPVLNYTRRDIQREYLREAEERNILEGVRLTISRLNESWQSGNARLELLSAGIDNGQTVASSTVMTRRTIVGCPATDETDNIALDMLKQILDPVRWELKIISNDTMTSELLTIIQASKPSFVYIMSISPGSIAHARYLCKRLRRDAHDIEIIVGRCGEKAHSRHDRDQLQDVGADFVATSIIESRNLLNARWPLKKTETLSRSSFEGCETSKIVEHESRDQVLSGA